MTYPLKLLPLLVAMAGCATGVSQQRERIAAVPEDQRAYLLGTYVVSCQPRGEDCAQRLEVMGMHYKSISEPFEGTIKSRPDTKYDFVDRDRHEKGYHFCLPFVPGDYEFFNLVLHTYFGGGTDFGPKKHEAFSLPFSLKPGEAVHVGRLKVWLDTQRGLAPMPQFNSITLLTSEASNVEREAARAKCEGAVQSKPVRYAPLQPSVANSPRVRHESRQ